MNSLVSTLNSFISGIFDVLLAPFSALQPIAGLLFISALSGVFFLWVYGLTSNQKSIRDTKARIHGLLLEAVLFRHNPQVSLKAQGCMLKEAANYFCLALPPILILAAPCLLILAQLNIRYGYRPFTIHEKAILTVKAKDASLLSSLKLTENPSFVVTPPLHVAENNEVYWRIEPVKEGELPIWISLKQEEAAAGSNDQYRRVMKVGRVADRLESTIDSRWWSEILYPAAEPLWKSRLALKEVSLSYPERHYDYLGMRLHWLVIFFLVSLLSGVIAAKLIGVEI